MRPLQKRSVDRAPTEEVAPARATAAGDGRRDGRGGSYQARVRRDSDKGSLGEF